MPTKSTIIVRYTVAELFGDQGSAGYDEEASAKEWATQARNKLTTVYWQTDWKIHILRSPIKDSIEVLDTAGHALPDEEVWVANILTELHDTWDWAVTAG